MKRFRYPEDIATWTGPQKRNLVMLLLGAEAGRTVGRKLHAKSGMPDLSGCFKLSIPGRDGWRAVYRIEGGCVELIAVGKRRENVAYRLAGERLNRSTLPMNRSWDGR